MKFRILFILFALTAAFAFQTQLFAKNQPSLSVSPEETDSYEYPKIPPILDPDYRHNKKYQFELSPFGGSYLSDSLGQTWFAGARGYFFLNNTTGIGLSYGISKLYTNKLGQFGRIMNDNNLSIMNAEVQFSNDAALRVGTTLIEMDFYLTLGTGAMNVNTDWEPTGLIGGGVKVYTPLPWLAFRVDVNNYIYFVETVTGDEFNFDVTFLGGISFLFPPKKSHK